MTEEFYGKIAEQIAAHGLGRATMVFPPFAPARRLLPPEVLFQITIEEYQKVRAGESLDLTGRFWFSRPEHLDDDAAGLLQRCGALVIPALNVFCYVPRAHRKLAREDMRRMNKAGVDGFQIDSTYGEFFRAKISGDAPVE